MYINDYLKMFNILNTLYCIRTHGLLLIKYKEKFVNKATVISVFIQITG